MVKPHQQEMVEDIKAVRQAAEGIFVMLKAFLGVGAKTQGNDSSSRASRDQISEQAKIGAAFNEWMRRYTDDPERFSREWETVGRYLEEVSQGQIPGYGDRCAAYLHSLIAEAETSLATVRPSPPPHTGGVVKKGP